jgi:RHS repeat-associated protein
VVGFDPAFQKSTFSYDAGANVLEKISYGTLGGPTPAPSDPPGSDYPEISRERFYYDEMGRLRRTDSRFFKYLGTVLIPLTTDSNAGLATAPSGEPVPSTGDGWVTSLVGFDRLGRVVRSVDDNGHSTETRYDGLGRKLKILMNVASPFSVDPGNPLNNRNAIDTVYDANGNVTQITETEYGADRSGSSPRLLPAQQHRSTFKYDSMNRQIEAKLLGRVGAPALNLTTTTVYDSRGNTVQRTDPAGGRSKSTYDGLNRLTKTEAGYLWNGSTESIPANMMNSANPDGRITTTYGYDANSRLTSVKDDNNRVTSFLYDSLGRQTRITYPDGIYREVTYDKDSLATSWTQFSNTGYFLSSTIRFDRLHRATQKDIYNSQAPWVVGTQRQTFEYDGLGRITLAEDDANPSDGFVDSEVVLAYNSMGKVLSEAQTWRDASSGTLQTGTQTVSSVYDGVGFRRSVAYPNDRTVSFLPDELNRAESIVDSATGTIRYDYLGAQRVLNRLYPNGTKLTMLNGASDDIGAGYDAARRIVDFASKLSSTGTPLAEFTYGYDNAGNRTSERRVHEPSGANWKGETYGYDAVYRLINRKEGDLNGSGLLQGTAGTTQGFTLDGAGNWKTHKKNSSTYNQTINSLNQYTVFNGSLGQRTLNYDFLGNLTNESLASGDQQYSYDFLNRLAMVLDVGGNLTRYRYDALGRRISKNLNGWTHTRYVYDGNRLIQERDGTGQVVASYVYGMGSDEVLTRRRWQGGVPSDLFYHTNALGSVSAVTSNAGAVVERYKYDAYGQVTFLSPSFTPLTSSAVYNNVLFTGRYFDTETKLYYYRARTYHPYLGRFLQRDPLGEAASLNLYNYVFNNPVNATDPTGMWVSLAWEERFNPARAGWGPSSRQRMQYRAGSYVSHGSARYQNFDDEQAHNDEIADAERENMEWEAKEARIQAYQGRKDKQVKQQIEDSKQKNADAHKQADGSIAKPKGVLVIFYGFGQDIESGGVEGSDLDKVATDARAAGYDVFEFEGDSMGSAANFSEVSASTVQIVAEAVNEVAQGGSQGTEVLMIGFSRGAGPMVAVGNALASMGINTAKMADIDGKLGSSSNTLISQAVDIRVFRPEHWTPTQWAAPLLGLHGNIYMGSPQHRVPTSGTYNTTHGGMDQYGTGALGYINCWFFGGSP